MNATPKSLWAWIQGAEETACEKENASEISQIRTNHFFFAPGRPVFFRRYPSGLNASVLRLEVELETEPVWLWEKQRNDFAALVRHSPEGMAGGPWSTLLPKAWMGSAEAFSHHVWAHCRGWALVSSLDSLSQSALVCLWDLPVTARCGRCASWRMGAGMPRR